MFKKPFSQVLALLFFLLFFSQCVTRKQYDRAVDARRMSSEQLASCQTQRDTLKQQVVAQQDTLSKLQEEYRYLVKDTMRLSRSLKTQIELNKEQKRSYETLIENHERLLNTIKEQDSETGQDLQAANKQIENLEAENRRLLDKNERISKELVNCYSKNDEFKTKLTMEQKATENAEKAYDELYKIFSPYLKEGMRAEKELPVTSFTFPEGLFFKRGKTQLGVDMAYKILTKASDYLREHPSASLVVTIHSDDLPVQSSCLDGNLDYTSMRASSISERFKLNGISSEQVLVSGKGYWSPQAQGQTAEIRERNRRLVFEFYPNGLD